MQSGTTLEAVRHKYSEASNVRMETRNTHPFIVHPLRIRHCHRSQLFKIAISHGLNICIHIDTNYGKSHWINTSVVLWNQSLLPICAGSLHLAEPTPTSSTQQRPRLRLQRARAPSRPARRRQLTTLKLNISPTPLA